MEIVVRVSVGDPKSHHVDAACHLFLEIASGRRIPLLTDRGWGSSCRWADASLPGLESDAVMVVGPDEPFGELTESDMASDHWSHLASVAQAQGVSIDAAALAHLKQRVEFADDILRRVGASAGPAYRPEGTTKPPNP